MYCIESNCVHIHCTHFSLKERGSLKTGNSKSCLRKSSEQAGGCRVMAERKRMCQGSERMRGNRLMLAHTLKHTHTHTQIDTIKNTRTETHTNSHIHIQGNTQTHSDTEKHTQTHTQGHRGRMKANKGRKEKMMVWHKKTKRKMSPHRR